MPLNAVFCRRSWSEGVKRPAPEKDKGLFPVIRLAKQPSTTRPPGIYGAKLLFEFCVVVSGKPGDMRLCEERLVLLNAPTARHALKQATAQGKASQHQYKNGDGNPVRFRFVGVLDLCHLGGECEPNEVWYSLGHRLRPMERRRTLIPRPGELSAIRSEERA